MSFGLKNIRTKVGITNALQLTHLNKAFDKLHLKYGDPNLNPIYGAGQIRKPKIAFVFINPTARNVAAHKTWQGIKAPWLGTKQVWKLSYKLQLLTPSLYQLILRKKPQDWTADFAIKVYTDIRKHNVYITNLSKATQKDARKLNNSHLKAYLPLFWKEMEDIQPQFIVTFGAQVTSVILNRAVKISNVHGKIIKIEVKGRHYNILPGYYPVGQGSKNMGKVIEMLSPIVQYHSSIPK